jgi:hypothetical protein
VPKASSSAVVGLLADPEPEGAEDAERSREIKEGFRAAFSRIDAEIGERP